MKIKKFSTEVCLAKRIKSGTVTSKKKLIIERENFLDSNVASATYIYIYYIIYIYNI